LFDNGSFATIEYDDVWYVLNMRDYGANGLDVLSSLKARVEMLDANIPITLNKDIPLTKIIYIKLLYPSWFKLLSEHNRKCSMMYIVVR